jgi:hypothetical protein
MKFIGYPLTKRRHTLTIGYREDGACLDKLCITNSLVAPTGMGEADPTTLGVNSVGTIDGYTLGQNYPNPFNPETTISFGVLTRSFVSLDVFDVLGRGVGNLVNGMQEPGRYSVNFDASKLSSGMYIYRLASGKFTQAKKMMVVK